MNRGLSDLHHDVGKRIARTARNVRVFPVPPAILALLVKDLYAIDGSARASAVFEARAHDAIDEALCRDALRAIDAIEHDVRAGDEHAVREAIRLALVVADHISARVHEAVS